jgi:hypothetical protein
MLSDEITVTTNPPDLIQRFEKYPQQLDAVMHKTAEASMLHVQGSVPPYPPPPSTSTYQRTGQLGRSLGVGMGGGVAGQPSVRLIKKLGAGSYEATFGTNLEYAPAVIGTESQKQPFKKYWWTMRTVARQAMDGVVKLYDTATRELAKWLEGR